MRTDIRPYQPDDLDGLHAALDQVAREGEHFLDFTSAPPRPALEAFYRTLAQSGWPHYVAVQGARVVGWVTAAPCPGQTRAHAATIGIGLLAEARGQGNGTRLLTAAIDHAWQIGLTRLELTVRIDNHRAIALYERLGFTTEGRMHHAMRSAAGHYTDAFLMALLAPERGLRIRL